MSDQPPSHHRLATGLAWPYWQWAVVRMAGFPYAALDRLTLPRTVRLGAELQELEASAEGTRQRALRAFTETSFENLNSDLRRVLVVAARRIAAAKELGEIDHIAAHRFPEAYAKYSQWHDLFDARRGLIRDLQRTYERELLTARCELCRLVSDDGIREAILWQSRSAYDAVVRLVAEEPTAVRNRAVRRREWLAAMYLQRFFAKNDTVGFFGPRSIASVGDRDGHLDVEMGEQAIARRLVFFEHWAMTAIAERIAKEADVQDWLMPRRSAQIALDGGTLHYPVGRTTELSREETRLLDLADGRHNIAELERLLVSGTAPCFATPDALRKALNSLEIRGLLCRVPVVPTCDLRPDQCLRDEIQRLFPPRLAESWLACLDRLEEHRRELELASGPEAVGVAKQTLNETFERVAKRPAERAAGEVYGARQVAYLDCASGRDIALGSKFLDRLEPLELIYGTLRTYSALIWRRYAPELDALYVSMKRESKTDVDWISFIDRSLREILSIEACEAIQSDLHAAWKDAIDAKEDERQVERSYEKLRARLAPILKAEPAGWPSARFYSPDLMLAARDLDAVRRGDYLIVLGELHAFRNMICYPVALNTHPEIFDAVLKGHAVDVPHVLRPNVSRREMHRATHYLPAQSENVWMIDVEWPPPRTDGARLVAEADLVLVKNARTGLLTVTTRDQRLDLPLQVALNSYLGGTLSKKSFRILSGSHSPRLTVDGVVLHRESWTVSPPPVGRDLDGFLEMRRWARELGLPRHAFVKSPPEAKPFLVDFENPFLVEILSNIFRKVDLLKISEMLPTPDQLWLQDKGDARYTCEIRLCAVDPMKLSPGL